MIDEKKRLNIRESIQFFQAPKRKTEAQSKIISNKPLRIQVKKQNKNLCILSHGTLDREKPECLRKVLIVTLQLESCPNCQSRARVEGIFYARLFSLCTLSETITGELTAATTKKESFRTSEQWNLAIEWKKES